MSVKHVVAALLVGLFLAGSARLGQAQVVPVSVKNSGFSYDAIQEANGNFTADLSGDSTGASSYILVTDGYAAAHSDVLDPAGGLPDDGTITSATGAVFQLQPYDKSNVLVLNVLTGALTLEMSAPASYSEISFLVSNLTSDRHSSAITFTLNYTDGNSVKLPATDPVSNLNSAPSADATAAATMDSYVLYGAPQSGSGSISLSEYDFAVSAPTGELLKSVTVDPGLDQLDVYAISGTDPVAPEPPTWLLLLTGLGGSVWAARGRKLRLMSHRLP